MPHTENSEYGEELPLGESLYDLGEESTQPILSGEPEEQLMVSQKLISDPTKSMFPNGYVIPCDHNTIDVAMWEHKVRMMITNTTSEDELVQHTCEGVVMSKQQVKDLIAILSSFEVWMR